MVIAKLRHHCVAVVVLAIIPKDGSTTPLTPNSRGEGDSSKNTPHRKRTGLIDQSRVFSRSSISYNALNGTPATIPDSTPETDPLGFHVYNPPSMINFINPVSSSAAGLRGHNNGPWTELGDSS
ncbi:hypothetical protein F4810DRAFT_708508 [Camillea tinctor]|nr:hypothetical protein F4810DRAFT_708508 [Camillea tinctor]